MQIAITQELIETNVEREDNFSAAVTGAARC